MNGCAVGISAMVERAQWGPWDQQIGFTPLAYAHAVQKAGGLALLLVPDDAAEAAADRWLDRIEALLLSGGNDIDPAFYGQAPHPETQGIRPERDRFEIAIARGALERGMPVLGICRGMELLNVARGGDLIQHLPDVLGREDHRSTPGLFGEHEVSLLPGSLAARVVGAELTTAKSHHHQGVDRLGEGLKPSGWSDGGKVVEAIELDETEHPFALGVLWHPEEDEASRVVGALVEAAKVSA